MEEHPGAASREEFAEVIANALDRQEKVYQILLKSANYALKEWKKAKKDLLKGL